MSQMFKAEEFGADTKVEMNMMNIRPFTHKIQQELDVDQDDDELDVDESEELQQPVLQIRDNRAPDVPLLIGQLRSEII